MRRCGGRQPLRASELVTRLANQGPLPAPAAASWQAAGGVEVRGVTADSRQAWPGSLFVAVPGARDDGSRFIGDAVARGAVAVLARPGTAWPPGVPPRPLIEDAEPRRRLAQIAAQLAGPPPATLVAVTGTNGKTSTVDFLRQLWTLHGRRGASLGTLGVVAPGTDLSRDGSMTTPDPVALSETLAAMARAGIRFAALEASSHGLDQFRLDGLHLAAAGFTNLTRDHLDYHGTFDRYRAAKLRLFEALLRPHAPAVASTALDATTLRALGDIARRRHLDLRSVGEGAATVRLVRAAPRPEGQVLDIEVDGARHQIAVPLPGRFQADNALMAAALAEATGLQHPWPLLARLHGVRGRMELAVRLDHGAAAYVDYAHTPDALERLLTALRPHTAGRLVVVFGAGGDRDAGKRPLMGAACAGHADICIVTDDNPRGEDPAAIRAAVLAGCPGGIEVGDRAAAIAAGLDMLRAGDVLAVAGKGHEQGQTVGGTVLPFDDVGTVRRLAGVA